VKKELKSIIKMMNSNLILNYKIWLSIIKIISKNNKLEKEFNKN
jgi:hypothetical protein